MNAAKFIVMASYWLMWVLLDGAQAFIQEKNGIITIRIQTSRWLCGIREHQQQEKNNVYLLTALEMANILILAV